MAIVCEKFRYAGNVTFQRDIIAPSAVLLQRHDHESVVIAPSLQRDVQAHCSCRLYASELHPQTLHQCFMCSGGAAFDVSAVQVMRAFMKASERKKTISRFI